jgi:hypothetical protein
LTYVVEHNSEGGFTVMFSPDTAEDSPDYQPIGEFKTHRGALKYVQALQSGAPPPILMR